ncbi:MAG TPA: potassium-transporting ATPase subunit KdpC [Holophagaceae bacterium]|nr:potassium-transporting ATPase subunit KdpC [Holophagaceae bacterium]
MNLQLRPALVSFLAFSALVGMGYPLLVTGLARVAFPHQAQGSLIRKDGKVLGSEWIGRNFTDPRDFWGRPSATVDADGKPLPDNGANSGGSNLATSNPDLVKAVQDRATKLRAADPGNPLPIPADLVTASASGLDPDISPEAAAYQIHRVALARGLDEAKVRALVDRRVEAPTFGLLGEPRVNVQTLNLDLDALR